MVVSPHKSSPLGVSDRVSLGDPLSSYLFVLCAQGLSAIINHYALHNKIHGIKVARGSPTITHLFFADDNLLFFKANKENCMAVKECLQVYEEASGQYINFDKSAISFSKYTPQRNIAFMKN